MLDKRTQLAVSILKGAKSKLCQNNFVYQVPKVLAKKAEGYFSMRSDIEFIIDCVDTLMLMNEKVSTTIKSALWISIVTTLGKCFTDASRAKLPKLEIVDVKQKYISTHDELMHLRHSYAAHRGITEFEQSALFMLIPKADEVADSTEYKLMGLRQNYPDQEKLILYKEYFTDLLDVIDSKIQKSVQKTHSAFLELPVNKFIINNLIDDETDL